MVKANLGYKELRRSHAARELLLDSTATLISPTFACTKLARPHQKAILKMSFFGGGGAAATAAPEADKEMGDPPTDSISAIAFSGVADYMAVASWDNSVCKCMSLLLCAHFDASLRERFESTKLPPKDCSHKARPCTHIKVLSWMCAGIRCV